MNIAIFLRFMSALLDAKYVKVDAVLSPGILAITYIEFRVKKFYSRLKHPSSEIQGHNWEFLGSDVAESNISSRLKTPPSGRHI